MQGLWFWSQAGELRPHMPYYKTKRNEREKWKTRLYQILRENEVILSYPKKRRKKKKKRRDS